ncbi:MAG: TIGR02646 family protein [Lentisphaeria bacterium]|nr:TIGR02646 family protein [Lentisphaeria bacterium]
MKKINKSSVPSELQEYVSLFPVGHEKHTWKEFCENVTAKRAVQKQLKADQRGICAYCEIDLLDVPAEQVSTDGTGVKPDFRVDHFHPKQHSTNTSNCWELDWNNLFGVCAGGDESYVIDKTRFSEKKSNRHCDSKKKNNLYNGIILNPLTDIPAFPNLWKISSDENKIFLQPDRDACNGQGQQCLSKAEKTLEVLNLNCNKLAKFRAAALSELEDVIDETERDGISRTDAIASVMTATFNTTTSSWPPFFSTIRAYFGEYAEKQLHAIGYNG